MSGKIAVENLRVGMFVHLDLGWTQHPFPVGSFRITHAQQIDKIRGLGLKQLRWSPQRSELVAAPVASFGAHAQGDNLADGAAPPQPVADPPAQAAARGRRALLAAQRESAESCQRQFDEAGAACSAAFDSVRDNPEQARAQTESLSRAMLDKMLVDGDLCIRLLGCSAGDGASSHAMNVAVVSMLMGRLLGLGDAEMLDLGVGALLHDVGKLELAGPLRHADGRFDKDDLAAYRCHVAHGVMHGKRMGLSNGALLVLAQHHEHADGSGFPLHLKLERIALAARIVALVNRYDNLCNPPLPAGALTPHEALSMLFAQAKSQFDATLLNSFIRMMGVYPAGSAVQLTDDRYALVMSVNSTRPLKPKVLVYDEALPRDEALHLNLMTTADLGIRRSLKPAQLPADARAYLAPRTRVAYFFDSVRAELQRVDEAVDA